MPIMPFKLNQDRRHHIPRQARQVTNWPAYDASLRQRGSLTVWFTDEAVEAWAAEPRTTRGGQLRSGIVTASIAHWANATIGVPPLKVPVNAKFDRDVVDWFKRQARGYQTRMNAVLRTYMEAQSKPAAR